MSPILHIHEHRPADGEVTLALLGELDFASGAELAIRLADEARRGTRVTVDLGDLAFIDPAGMGVLHRAALWALEDGWTLSITGSRPAVRRVLELTQLDDCA